MSKKIAIWITRKFLAVQNGKDDPKPYLILDIVNVTCGHEGKKNVITVINIAIFLS